MNFPGIREVKHLANQLHLDIGLLLKELEWALGEERINRVTPSHELFREWSRRSTGLCEFWKFANATLNTTLNQEEVRDLWACIDLTLDKKTRKPLSFQDYLIVAVKSDQKCETCGRRPPEVSLDIDHIVPVSRGGENTHFNLRFLCEHHNRSRGSHFRWADIWRR